MHRKIAQLVTLVFLIGWFACCSGPDPDQPFQTRILEVRVQPNPVAVGDTVTFTCIIEDSLDERFKFSWNFDRSSDQDTTTEVNYVKWEAPDTVAVLNHGVNVDNGALDSLAPSRAFRIEVNKK